MMLNRILSVASEMKFFSVSFLEKYLFKVSNKYTAITGKGIL